jgi:hypothetical protein
MRNLIIVFLLAATPAFCETYSWEDSQGEHFTDTLQNVPPKFMDKAYVTNNDGSKETLKSSNKRNRAAAIEAEKRRKAELAKKPAKAEYTGPLSLSVGMDEKYLPMVKGEPDKVNVTESAYGRRKQYVYERSRGNDYVYTVNGRVTSWQITE